MGNKHIRTYMGYLYPNHRNITYSGAGMLSPLANDPTFSVIGSGTPIFLGGATGMVIGEGTQHSPGNKFGTLMTTGDMKQMSTEYIRAATITGYGVTMYVGVGIPIPVLNEDIVKHTAIKDSDIVTDIVDYGTPARDRPTIRTVTYAELKSGSVEINGEDIQTSPLSSYNKAIEIATELKSRIENGKFTMARATRPINATKINHPMKERDVTKHVSDVMVSNFVTIMGSESAKVAANKLISGNSNHLPVIDSDNQLIGIVTTFDISKAFATGNTDISVFEIMTRNVITAYPEEPIEVAARRLQVNNIGALPVIDKSKRVVGMLHSYNLGNLIVGRCTK